MKISKIIFISLLSTIALFILASVLYIRIFGYRNDDKTLFNVKKQLLPTIKVINISNSRNIEIFISDSTMIKSFWQKDSLIPNEVFKVKNDSLVLTSIKEAVMIKIYTNDSLRNIILKESDISIESVTSQHIEIEMDKSELHFNLADSNKHHMKTLKINAKNKSYVGTSNIKFDSLDVILQKSNAYFGQVAKISGSLSDSSRMNIQEPQEIDIKKDSTSRIYIYDWD